MIICHCLRVNDRVIRSAVREGAKNREQVVRACGAGGGCGGCAAAIEEIVHEEGSAAADCARRSTPAQDA